jgi:hypothetical protein
VALDVGIAKFQDAAESAQNSCAMHSICMTRCRDYLSDLAWYIGVCPKNLAKGVRALKRQSEDALKAAAEGQLLGPGSVLPFRLALVLQYF